MVQSALVEVPPGLLLLSLVHHIDQSHMLPAAAETRHEEASEFSTGSQLSVQAAHTRSARHGVTAHRKYLEMRLDVRAEATIVVLAGSSARHLSAASCKQGSTDVVRRIGQTFRCRGALSQT